MALEWAQKISSLALDTLRKRRYNFTELMPLTTDIMKLNSYLEKSIKYAQSELENDLISDKTWFKLANASLSRIIIFNKRRSGEASKIKIEDISQNHDWLGECTQELQSTLSPLEKQLCSRLSLINVCGKKGRKVPVILTEDIKGAMQTLLKFRNRVKSVLAENKYVFPAAHSKNHLRGDNCLKKMWEEAKLEKPELVTGTKLRKYMATVVQIFNLN